MMKRIIVILGIALLGFPLHFARAHCPLCTVGAGAAALGAKWLGFSTISIGVFIGAFSLALGIWMSRLIGNRFPGQSAILAIVSLVLTVLPLLPLMPEPLPMYVFFGGEYGSLFNRTYVLNGFLAGSLFGGMVMAVSPYLRRAFSTLNGSRRFPYQGLIITFTTLALVTVIIELLV
jgi:hypothetical protein